MRLHRLRIKAFGPFAGTEEVDFDRLGEAGLFLLHGQTGAGKTSVLDAVCYALYGRLPGSRGAIRPHLRSDHAAESERAEVRLELTVGGRRLEIVRSPEWLRPKKRGEGTTPEKATIAVLERVGGRWEPVTTRADEAGLLLQDLLGMRLDQFTKVVLLPQGEFAAFLRADAESRRALLQQLFSTGRFADVETWLAERRRELGRDVGTVRARSDELLARADEHAAALTGPARLDDDPDEVDGGLEGEAGPSAAQATPAARLSRLASRAAALAEQAFADAEAATVRAEASRAALGAGRELAGRQQQVRALAVRAAALLEAEAEQEQRRARRAMARRAAPLAPHLATVARLETEHDLAAAVLESARAAVPAALSSAGRLALDTARTDLGKALGRLSDARDVRDALAEQEAQHAEAAALASAATRSAEAAKAQYAAADVRLSTALQRQDAITETAARQPAAEAVLHELERIQRSIGAKAKLEQELTLARASVTERQGVALDLKEQWLALREERLRGIAAELSAGLRDGSPCPVCGSAEHPEPAPSHAQAVTREREQQAQADAFDADQALLSAREHAASLEAGVSDAVERVGEHTAKGIKAEIAAAKADLAATVDAADRLFSHRESVQALKGQLGEFQLLGEQLLTEAGAQKAVARSAATQIRRLKAKLETLRGVDPDIDAREARLQRELTAVGALLTALDDHERVAAALTAAAVECESAYQAAGFTDAAEAVTSLMSDADLAHLDDLVTAHDEQVASIRDRMADPELIAAAQLEAPDLVGLGEAETTDAGRRRAAEQAHARAEQARAALSRLAAELSEHEERSAGLLAESALVDDLARCVEGSGGDNVLRMRLSSYVLAARLEEVAAAATERLLVMSDGRYSLVHSDALARGGVRSGLGLRVIDGWTGVERDTATLSGGESFLASLALALGLADAVQAEAGGAVMETLFIDEGFGMLDEETLDEVMTVLDGLREGGRSVGLVSHVADLRARIPAQLEVTKSRTGSRIVIQEAAAAGAA